MDYAFFQAYWWAIISLLGALLVFLLFVQGGQGLLYTLGKTPQERDTIVHALGSKWSLTFTTLVTFGGAFFASFPLFYSTSFGGAVYVWLLILFVFVIQASGYEFRRKPNNIFGDRTYSALLQINGILAPLLLGTAVATLFTGAPFTVDRAALTNLGGITTVSRWATPWHGLDALTDYRNLALGVAVLLLSRCLGALYIRRNVAIDAVAERARKQLLWTAPAFVVVFLVFVVSLLLSGGQTDQGAIEPYKYLHNLLEMPAVAVIFIGGVLAVLFGLWKKSFWWTGGGTVATVFALLLLAGWNHTAYYPSTIDPASSLSIANSSSSLFTLKTMSAVSLLVPFVLLYIGYVWRAMNRRPTTEADAQEENY